MSERIKIDEQQLNKVFSNMCDFVNRKLKDESTMTDPEALLISRIVDTLADLDRY